MASRSKIIQPFLRVGRLEELLKPRFRLAVTVVAKSSTAMRYSLDAQVSHSSKLQYFRGKRLYEKSFFMNSNELRILSSHGLSTHFLGVLTSNASIISYGSLVILWFFLKISQMVICPVRGTYNRVTIFLCLRTKKAFKLPSRATFGIAKFPYLFRVSALPEILISLANLSDGGMYNQRYMSPRS